MPPLVQTPPFSQNPVPQTHPSLPSAASIVASLLVHAVPAVVLHVVPATQKLLTPQSLPPHLHVPSLNGHDFGPLRFGTFSRPNFRNSQSGSELLHSSPEVMQTVARLVVAYVIFSACSESVHTDRYMSDT